MQWLQAKTVKDLQSYGSYKMVRQEIQRSLGGRLILKVRGWQGLFEAIQRLQSLLTVNHVLEESSLYFNSEEARLIYALIELDGEQRLKELEVNKSFYYDLDKAKKWRNKIAKMIHPDICSHPKSALAINNLTKIFENMTGQ